MTNEGDNVEPITDPAHGAEAPAPSEVCNTERSPWLVQHRWRPGQSGNPNGRPRESGSLAAALRRVGVKPAKTRAELTKLAQQLGMDPEEARNIDVVAGLIYDGITQFLIRTVKGSTTAGDKLVGLLQLLFKALDGDERRITLSGPGELESALASFSAVLGFQPEQRLARRPSRPAPRGPMPGWLADVRCPGCAARASAGILGMGSGPSIPALKGPQGCRASRQGCIAVID